MAISPLIRKLWVFIPSESWKVTNLGLSEISASTLRRPHSVHPITAIQVVYPPFTLDIEGKTTGLLKTARELDVKIISYSAYRLPRESIIAERPCGITH